MKYIDVSEHQGTINWEKVKPNVDGVIIRAGYGQNNTDKMFLYNVAECNRLGIPCGAYWFSYAKSVDEAKLEASYLIDAVKPYRMELPLAFDFEYDSVKSAEKQGVTVDKHLVSNMVRAFCDTLEAAGYWALNYANPDFLNRYLDPLVPERYGLWLAQWNGCTPDIKDPPRSDAQIWQWTSEGSVPGITGNVDIDESYVDYASIIRERGLNNLYKPKDEKAEAIAWAMENGISGSEDIALALWRYHKAFGK